MVNEDLKLIYFPIPKSACTLFATFMAVTSDRCSDFDPERQGIHSYRLRNGPLSLTDFRVLKDPDFFRFTVVRDPFSRLVSAYMDKCVKPIRAGRAYATYERLGKYSFSSIVEALSGMSDAAIEKHFRPQISFIRNVPLDHVGVFDDLENTFRLFRERLGIDVEQELSGKIKAPKRTNYSKEAGREDVFFGELTANELAGLEALPPASRFYDERLRGLVASRYSEDIALYERALAARNRGNEESYSEDRA